MQNGQTDAFWARWNRIIRIYEDAAGAAGLSVLQLRLLETAERLPGCTQKTLCELLELSKQRVSLMVKQFVSGGILELQPDEADARRKRIVFTARGREAFGPVLEAVREQTAAALGGPEPHVHVQPDGSVTEHTHAHGHTHPHENTKEVLDRLARLSGHLGKVRSMVENGADCSEVLIQLAAVKSAITSTGKLILKDHIGHCLVDAIECGDPAPVEELKKAIDQFIK